MKISTSVKVLLTLVFLSFASALHAQSNRVTIGTYSGQSLEIDMMSSAYAWAGFTLYQDGQAILSGDLAGITYAAPGVSWAPLSQGYSYYQVYDLTGEISIELNCIYGGSYSSSGSMIEWIGNWGDWFYLYWI